MGEAQTVQPLRSVQTVQPLRSVQVVSDFARSNRWNLRLGLNDLNGWNGLNDWNEFMYVILAAREPPCRNFYMCAVFHRWRSSDRPDPRDRPGNRQPLPKFRKLCRRTYYRTT